MNIEKVAEKLRPLMPDEVDHWMRSIDFADSELKTLLDQQIRYAAYEKLGDFSRKILLSLPSKDKAKGEISLGTILYEKEKWPLGISQTELMQNLAIFGRSGAGKTNLSFTILKQLTGKGIPFLFLDWKRTARHLLPQMNSQINIYTAGRSLSKFIFNPFVVPPGIEPHVYLNHVVDVLADSYTLGDGAKSIISEALHSCYEEGNTSPLPSDIISRLKLVSDKGRASGWKTTALRALESIQASQIIQANSSQDIMIDKLLNGNTIVELDSLNHNMKSFIVPLLFFWVYQGRLKSTSREKLSLVVFIEEAHHVLFSGSTRSKETTMEMLLRQCREIGIGTVIIDQQPSLISSSALANTYTSICMNMKNPSDINKASNISLLDTDDKHFLSKLPVGWGIVKLQDRWTKPVLVSTPLINVKKGQVSDLYLQKYFLRSGIPGTVLPNANHNLPSGLELSNENNMRFVQDVIKYPLDGVKVRYTRLGLSIGTGNKVKSSLIRSGILNQCSVELGKTRKAVLTLTAKGNELSSYVKTYGNESVAHRYWKQFYAKRFSEAGYVVLEEATRKTGTVDLLVARLDLVMAVEIETGKSDVVKNVVSDLTSGVSRVLVVATDKNAFDKVEREITLAGLLIPGKVELVLQDDYLPARGLDLEIG